MTTHDAGRLAHLPIDALVAAGVTTAASVTTSTAGASTGAQWLAYRRSGATTTGTLTAEGVALPQATFPLDPQWATHVALGDGRVAFQRGDLLTVGEVRPDGTWTDLRDNHQAPIVHQLLPVGPDLLVSYLVQSGPNGYVGVAIIGRVMPDGAYVRLSEPHLWDFWTHIVPVQDGLVLFYNSYSRLAATGRVTPDGEFVDLSNHPGFDPWTHIVAAADGMLLFDRAGGSAASGRVEADGGFTNLRRGAPFLGGWSFTPTRDSRLIMRPPQGAPLVARFPVDGWIADARPLVGELPPDASFVR